jgi:hypothetical protein
LHRQLLRESFKTKVELDVQRASDLERDRPRLTGEPRHHDGDIPLSDAERGQKESSFLVGHAFDHGAAGRMLPRDRCARQDAARSVFHDAADLAGVRLGCDAAGNQEKDK